MNDLTDQQAIEFLRRSYTAVDGLWFMKVEEQLGLQGALALDHAVWKVMPKIQARALKALTGLTSGMAALYTCLTAKYRWEEYTFDAALDTDGQGFSITIRACPWHRLLVKSGRTHLAPQVGPLICEDELSVWAAEFGGHMQCELGNLMCQGAKSCHVRFSQRAGNRPPPTGGDSPGG